MGQANEEMGPVEVEESHRRRPEWLGEWEAATVESSVSGRPARRSRAEPTMPEAAGSALPFRPGGPLRPDDERSSAPSPSTAHRGPGRRPSARRPRTGFEAPLPAPAIRTDPG